MKKIVVPIVIALTISFGFAQSTKPVAKPAVKPKPGTTEKAVPAEKTVTPIAPTVPAPKPKPAKEEPRVVMSKPFQEPEFWTKLLLMKSGLTLMFEITDRDGMKVTTFNEKHAGGIAKPLPLKTVIKKMQYTDVLGVYEINNQAVVFIQQFEKPNPQLIRVILDPKSGKLISETVIANLPEMNEGDGFAMAFGGVDAPGFDVVKDNSSDAYSVVTYNSFASDANQRIELVAYDGSHKETARAFYNCPKEYTKLRYLNAYSYGTAFTYMAVYGFNGNESDGDSRIYLARLKNGNNTFKSVELEYTDSFDETSCEMSFNKKSGLLNFILCTSIKEKKHDDTRRVIFQPVHPEGFKLDTAFDLPCSKVKEYAKNKLGYKNDYESLVMDIYLDDDGNYHALLQNTTIVTKYGKGYSTYNLKLDDWGYEVFDNSGNEISGTAFNLHYDCDGINALQGGAWFRYRQAKKGFKPADRTLAVGKLKHWYKTIDMIYSSKANIVLLNDKSDNFDLPENKKGASVKSMGDVTSMMYHIQSDGTFKKEYLFGNPKDKNDNKFCNFYASSYNPETNVYATIMTDEGQDKKTYVVWIKL